MKNLFKNYRSKVIREMEDQGGQDRGGQEAEDKIREVMMNGIMPNGNHHLGHGNNQ